MRVVCAMSGGVDSSIAASMMVEAGHDVIGLTMSLYDADPGDVRRGRGGTCCSPAEVDLARRVCDQLGVPHYSVDERRRFQEHVIDDFAREYAAGRTPNPCARCNEHVKFAPLLERARGLGAELLVTGHYARIEDGALLRALDRSKDQSYFLFGMGRDTLDSVAFPLGGSTKDDVRARARTLDLPNWDAPDSQELCFVPGGDHSVVVERRLAELGADVSGLEPGPIVDTTGAEIGTHAGIHRLTVGQRRGLGVSGREPRYVLRVVPETRTVVVGASEGLAVRTLIVEDFRRMAEVSDGEDLRANVQFRHGTRSHLATVRVDGPNVVVEFDEPVRAAAPGQAVVVYAGDRVLGGGWLRAAH